MEVDPQPITNKRPHSKLVDPDEQTVISAIKKPRVKPDKQEKVAALKFIAELYKKINDALGIDLEMYNVSLGSQVANIAFTTFVINKQRANGLIGNAEKTAISMKTFSISSLGRTYSVNVETTLQLCKDAAATAGLEFKKYDPKDRENWYGTAAPYLDFFCANHLRLNELRLGHSTMPIGKENGVSITTPVAKYGLDGSHHVLLEGSSYPPEKRNAMAQSVGPMTAFLCHVRSEEKYRQKWTDAAKRALMHIPHIAEILEVVKNKKATEVSTLIRILADVTLIAGARQAQRMTFPMNMFARVYFLSVAKEREFQASAARSGSSTAPQTRNFMSPDEMLEGFNISGKGGYYWYKVMSSDTWIMEGEMNDNEASQILFHSIFGTFKEDLSVLAKITNLGTWSTREDMSGCFQRMKTCGKSVQFKPVQFVYYSKLSSANMTGMFSSKYTQTCAVPVFGGRRTQHFSDEFFEQIGRRTGHTSVAKSIPQLIAALTDILSAIKEGKKMEMRTVEWRNMSDLRIAEDGSIADVNIVGTNRFFLGTSD